MTDSIASIPENYQPADGLLKDKIILITGAGSGIGRSAALCFARHGATTILLGRTMEKLEAVYDEIEAEGLPQPAIYPLNLEGATHADFESMCDILDGEFGKLDGILHNASELGDRMTISDYAPDTWSRVMQVNVNAPFLLSKALLPLLDKSTAERIVFTGSSVGRKGRAYWGAYAASKAAQENLMQTLADELEDKKVGVNSINPGATRTAMRAAAYPAENPDTLLTPEDLMPLYLYLLSEDSERVTGKKFDAQ